MEGSPEVLAAVDECLSEARGGQEDEELTRSESTTPNVFLSYGWEDRDLAERIALALINSGIDTWWAEWSISAGDSLPQKINEGLSNCTHFVVLLTRTSIAKPWVQHEMDVGLIKRISEKAKFIPLRHKLPAGDMPLLLRSLLSPEVNDPPSDIQQLINDIHGISRKPALGRPPVARIETRQDGGYSAAANAVAKVFVERSKAALFGDPQVSVKELASIIGITYKDVEDGLHELGDLIARSARVNSSIYYPRGELFVRFDAQFCAWDPEEDALRLATDLLNDAEFPTDVPIIAQRYGWDARRINPALTFLSSQKLARVHSGLGHQSWAAVSVLKTEDTRRFVRSRSL